MHTGNRTIISLQWIIAGLLFGYIICRACLAEITQDEAYSYLLAKTYNIRAMGVTANTHWLNTLSMRLFLWLPGEDSLWKIRSLSLICWPVYAVSTIRLSHRFESRWLGFAFFAVAVLNPFLLFYFSMARGYAAACAFIMLALWLSARNLQSDRSTPAQWLPVFLSATLAVMANFTSFYFFMAITVVYLLHLTSKRRLSFVRKRPFQPFNLLVITTGIISVAALLVIKYRGNDLEFGSTKDPIGSILGSLIANSRNMVASAEVFSTADEHYDVSGTYFTSGILLLLLLFPAFVYSLNRFIRKWELSPGGFVLFILFVIVVMSLLFRQLFNTPYLADRNSLILFPVVVTGLFFTADQVHRAVFYSRIMVPALTSAVMLLCLVNFTQSYRLTWFREWSLQADTQEGLDYLEQAKAVNPGLDLWHYSVFVNYYSLAFPDRYHFKPAGIDWRQLTSAETAIQPGSEGDPTRAVSRIPGDPDKVTSFDYLFLSPPYRGGSPLLEGFKDVRVYPHSQARIFRRISQKLQLQ